MRAAYIDIELILKNKSIQELITTIPHLFKDSNDQVVSEYKRKKVSKCDQCNLMVDGESFGIIQEEKNQLEEMIVAEIRYYKEDIKNAHSLIIEDMVAKDIDKIVDIASQKKISAFEAISNLLLLMRSYVPFEKCNVFMESPDRKLRGYIIISSTGEIKKFSDDHVPLEFDTLGGVCFVNQKTFIVDDISKNSLFKIRYEEYEVPDNIACFPLSYNKFSIGVLNITNNLLNKYSSNHINIISRFLVVLNHILFQEQTKKYIGKMDKFNEDLRFYVSNNLYKSIVENENDNLSKVQMKNVTCLFADIRSFTSISEQLIPEDLVRLLNIFFKELTPIIEEYGGTVDKFAGDMISAFWNAPNSINDPELKAVQAAIKMQKRMIHQVLPNWINAGVPYIGIGIGVHVGQATAGHVGPRGFNNYTVVGINVERARWLESLAKPAEICVSKAIYSKVKDKLIPIDRKELNKVFRGYKRTVYVYKPEKYIDYT